MNKLVVLFLLSGLILQGAEEEEVSPALPHFELVKNIPALAKDPVRTAKWHPEGKLISACGSGKILTIDPETDATLQTLTCNGITHDYNSDGTRIASADSRLQIWDTEYGTLLRQLKQNYAQTVAWAHDNSCIACGGGLKFFSQDGAVKIWDPRAFEIVQTLINEERTIRRTSHIMARSFVSEEHLNGTITSLDWATNGFTLATGSKDKEVTLWDTRTGKKVAHVPCHRSWINSICFHPTDPRIVTSGSLDNTIVLINTEEFRIDTIATINAVLQNEDLPNKSKVKEIIARLQGHKKSVSSVGWSPYKEILASGSDDQTIKLWRPDGCFQTLQSQSPINTVDWHPERLTLIVGSHNGTVSLYSAQETNDTEKKEVHEAEATKNILNAIRETEHKKQKAQIPI